MASAQNSLNGDTGLLRRLEDLIANSPLVVTEWDKDFRLLYWSPGAERVFGWKAADVVGKNPYEMGFIHPEDVPHVKGLIQRMTSAHEQRNLSSNRNFDKFGNVHFCDWYNSALIDKDGAIRSILSVGIEVTDRHIASEALRASDERLRMAQSAANAGVWDWDLTTGEQLWTPELYELFGLDPREVHPSIENFLMTVHPEDRPMVSRTLREAVSNQVDIDVEFRVQRTTGETRWFNSKGRIYYGPEKQPARVVGIMIDVTDRVQLIAELRTREERLRLSQRAARIGSWKWDIATGKVEMDQELWHLFGLDENTAQPDFDAWLQLIHPEDRTHLRSQLQHAVDSTRELNVEFRCVWPDGSMHYLRSLGRCAYGPNGKPLYMTGINMDMTERRRSEELLRIHDQLAASGRMAASLAHEINNPLAAVTNVLYLLSQQELSGTSRQYVQLASDELERVASITRNILGLYRDTPAPVGVKVCELVGSVLTMYRPAMRRSNIELITDFTDDDIVMAFPAELRQLFSSLISNAVEAMSDQGRGCLKLRVRRSRNGANGEQGVRVMISDNGPGIPANIRERMFEPFYTTKGERGSGLGLWISSEIVRKHGGSLRVRTVMRRRPGTVLNVFLPAQPREPNAPTLR